MLDNMNKQKFKNKNSKRKNLNLLKIEIIFLLAAIISTTAIVMNYEKEKQTSKHVEKIKKQQKENKNIQDKTIKNCENYEQCKNEYKNKNYKTEKEQIKNVKNEQKKNSNKNNKTKKNITEEIKNKNNKDIKQKIKNKEDKNSIKEHEEDKSKIQYDWQVLSSYTTKLDTKRLQEKNRLHNIRTAIKYLNNLIIGPGEIFSFYQKIWDEGKDKNYRSAQMISIKGIGMGIGGGVCQVATTLFGAILRAFKIEILERKSHSRKVDYGQIGLDASFYTIKNTLKKNLVFKNTRKYPIKLQFNISNNELTAEILSIKDEDDKNYYVIIGPAKKVKETNDEEEYEVLVETRYKDQEIKKQLFVSTYKKD